MLRKRKNRRYNEETNDEEEEGARRFDIQEQIRSKRFEPIKEKHLQELTGEAITLKLIQKSGFDKPILVEQPQGLELRVPGKSFLVKDVRNCVGHQRIIDVMDVKTQKNIEMSMKDWCKYYESKNRDRLLNVISLEFSHTKLDDLVDSPQIVKLLDWVDLVWPKFLKDSQTESTNSIDRMKYPKVQKYCLMSVKGSYTDFHIDFGGTSVWYHILRGKKIFWMVPPTELNLQTFEEWTLSGMQQDVFFGDTVEECFRVELSAGNTFFIPSGWIHAVYTLEDSLVFGGNFLHSFGIENQLKVSRIEDATKVPLKFRYPFYTEILWYVVQHYVYCLTGKDHLHRQDSTKTTPEKPKQSGNTNVEEKIKSEALVAGDGETTESEQDESDKKKRKTTATAKRKVVARKNNSATKKSTSKKAPADSSDDDESTEIDSANEEETNKPTNKKVANTCRMTKNSLLRLQYEIDEQCLSKPQLQNKSNQGNKQKIKDIDCSTSERSSSAKKSTPNPKTTPTVAAAAAAPQHKSETQPSPQVSQLDTSVNSSHNSLNFAELKLPQEALSNSLNGWCAKSAAQTTWSNPDDSEPKSPPKIHITKYELNGLKLLVKHLSKLSGAKKNMPSLIRNSRALLDDCRKLINEHENDDPELAVTGKAITPELFFTKKSNMNELIEQFFKPSEVAAINDPDLSHAGGNKIKLKSEAPALAHQQRLKFNGGNSDNSSGPFKIDERKTSSSHDVASNKQIPQKETRCLSPNKRLSTSTTTPSTSTASASAAAGSSTVNPPARPKSPPTRPLSNNQYASKSKNIFCSNNLLLPGSFADLIAATSTEKKVFDIDSSEVTSSLFGAREPSGSPTKTAAHSTSRACLTRDSEKLGSSNPLGPNAGSKRPTSHDLSPATSTPTPTATMDNSKIISPKPNSPEPPKASPQKRFINPAIRPQNKEKLIFASAPYVSPVHTTDPTRIGNLYPWQSPALPQSQTPAYHNQQNPSTHNQAAADNRPNTISTAPGTAHQPIYKPDTQQLVSNKTEATSSKTPEPQTTQAKSINAPVPTNESVTSNQKDQTLVSNKVGSAQKVALEQQNSQPQHNQLSQSHAQTQVIGSKDVIDVRTKAAVAPGTSGSFDSRNNQPSPVRDAGPTKVVEANATSAAADIADPKTKKPTKPRGPPKKSKEARQVLDSITAESMSVVAPISVIKAATGSQSASYVIAPIPPPTASTSGPIAATGAKAKQLSQATNKDVPKAKRPKKQNDPVAQNLNPPMAKAVAGGSKSQQRAPMICGLVTPPITTTSTTPTHATTPATLHPNQQYLIHRPLLFNSMPNFSPAQLQQISRASMPMLSSSIPTSLGLPTMQQGARIVWATQPRRLPAPSTTSAQQQVLIQAAPATKNVPPRYPASSTAAQPDNAALLSLATTALSTAPMTSSPALSHIGARAPATQAFMVNSAANQAAIFAGQQFFSPYLQRMPMTHFAARPGVARPSGQLVFARLPNQNQPRYLITQPGFIPQQRGPPPAFVGLPQNPGLSFAAYKPPGTDAAKAIKTKKVKTS